MKKSNGCWDSLLIASVAVIAVVCAQAQQVALGEDEQPNGRIVQISPDQDAGVVVEGEEVVVEPKYWIGIQGRSVESEVLRTHLQLAQDMGVVVERLKSNLHNGLSERHGLATAVVPTSLRQVNNAST